jgi:hypothetical protein
MKCPSCGSEDIRAAECLELVYDLGEDGEPGELINGHEIFEPPGDCYYLCAECDRRWDLDGTVRMMPAAVPASS